MNPESTLGNKWPAAAPPLQHPMVRKPQHTLRQPGLIELQRYDPRYPGLLLQPDSRPISQEQLASEVKSIYAGLTMVETKCIHVDRAQAAARDNHDPSQKLAADHWQVLIALHRTLLHEHHDFFLASQHSSASPALRRLAAKYSMPARMWKHGIHSFLELLRRRLPESIDYMLAFIYLAYQMMALLYETVPAFEDTWIECLGDLGRYRMAIEEERDENRKIWAGVARTWYTKAADKNPTVGRLYHHLAILARPNALQQLYHCSRSLTCVRPFPSARESILTLLDPILARTAATYARALPIDTNFIKAHALLPEKPSKSFDEIRQDFVNSLDSHIGRVTAKWKEQGVYIAVTNVASWFDYGVDDNVLRQHFLCDPTHPKWAHEASLQSDLPKSPPILSSWSCFRTCSSLLSQPWDAFNCSYLSFLSLLTHFTRCALHKSALILLLTRLPFASAFHEGDTNSGGTSPNPNPIFGEDTPFDYIAYGLMVVYVVAAWLLRRNPIIKTVSFAVLLAMAILWPVLMGSAFPAGVRKTAFKAWATTMFHYELLDCVESYKPKEHIIKFLGLSVIFVFIGSALQQFSETSLLVTFPPSLALAAVITWAITKTDDAADRNRHQENPPQREADLEAGPHDQRSRSDRSRRNSNTIGSDLPHSSNFTIGTDSDLESLRSRQ